MLAVLLALTFSIIAFAEDDIEVISGDANVRTWVCWVQDGNEITVNQVTTNDSYIVKDLSSNWIIKQQDLQSKITDTYWSPATVWTVNASQVFELAFEVFGGTKVEIGFLHSIGASSTGGVNLPCSADGHELVQWCKLYESEDGTTWTEVDSDILPAADALVSGMTGYENTDIHPYNGNGETEYSEAYFVISGTVSNDAKYVKYSFAGNGRNHYWDPCVRDAIFTAPVGNSWEPAEESDTSDESSTPVEYNPWINAALDCSYEVISGTVRSDGYGDPDYTKLTDGIWSDTGSNAIGALDSPTGSVAVDFGAEKSIKKITADLWYGAWGVTEPENISFYYSVNGTDYTMIGTAIKDDAEVLSAGEFSGYLFSLTLDEPISMRYLRVDYNGTSHIWTSEIGAYEYVPENTEESETESAVESSTASAESSESGTPITGDAGIAALAIISVIALAGVVVIKRK